MLMFRTLALLAILATPALAQTKDQSRVTTQTQKAAPAPKAVPKQAPTQPKSEAAAIQQLEKLSLAIKRCIMVPGCSTFVTKKPDAFAVIMACGNAVAQRGTAEEEVYCDNNLFVHITQYNYDATGDERAEASKYCTHRMPTCKQRAEGYPQAVGPMLQACGKVWAGISQASDIDGCKPLFVTLNEMFPS